MGMKGIWPSIFTQHVTMLLVVLIFFIAGWYFIGKDQPPIYNSNAVTDLNADSYIPVSEYIPSDSSSFSDYIFSDGAALDITPSTPDKGIETEFAAFPLLTWQKYKYIENKGRVSINVDYPHFLGNKNGDKVAKLNTYIENYVKKAIDDDRKLLADIIRKDPDTFEGTLDLSILYRLIGVTNGIVSIEMAVTDYTGGGNGNHSEPVTINWDLKSNRLLAVDDLFCSKNYIESLVPVVRKEIISVFENSPGILVDGVTVSWINEGTTPEKDNWKHFLIKKDGVIVVFPPYQVTSGSGGIVRVFIPNTSVPGLLCLP